MDKDLIKKHREKMFKMILNIQSMVDKFEDEYLHITDEEFHEEMTRDSKGSNDFLLFDILRDISKNSSMAMDQFEHYSRGY